MARCRALKAAAMKTFGCLDIGTGCPRRYCLDSEADFKKVHRSIGAAY